MKDTRLWIALLALVSFFAGSASTVLVYKVSNDDNDSSRVPFDAYADRLVERFDLSPERAVHLRFVLREYARKIDGAYRAGEEELYDSLRGRLQLLGTEYNDFIRENVLPDDSRRDQFDHLAVGIPF